MVTRVLAKHLYRHILRFGAILALALLCTGFSVTSAVATNPYEYTDGSEGDPGDGVLNPRAGEDVASSADIQDEGVNIADHGYLLVPVFNNRASSGIPTLRFLLIRRPESGFGIVTGITPWFSAFSGRGWNHAR